MMLDMVWQTHQHYRKDADIDDLIMQMESLLHVAKASVECIEKKLSDLKASRKN